MLDKILVINTGGTIGMIHSEEGNPLSPLRPAEDWHEITKEHPILNRFSTDYHQITPLIDSSDMNPEIWIKIAKEIERNYDQYRGFVVLHGTDTMAYTSSALSFMLKNLDKPVVITGSQVPLEKTRSDALQNLVTAIQIAGNEINGIRNVPEVSIFFRDTLLRGNRARKLDASNYFGFSSPNYSALGEAGGELKIKKYRLRKPSSDKFEIETRINGNVIMLEVFPGINIEYLKSVFKYNKNLKGLILKTYGNGNAPTTREFLDIIKYISSQGVVIVNITKCTTGSVRMGLYEASAGLVDAGVVNGGDLTPEAALTKLMHLLGVEDDIEKVKKRMQIDICGEQTLNYYDFVLEIKDKKKATFEIEVPKKVTDDCLVEAMIRLDELSFDKNEKLSLEVTLKGDKNIENIEYYTCRKTVEKKMEEDENQILLSFNRCTRKLARDCDKIEITIKSNVEISGRATYSIYSEN